MSFDLVSYIAHTFIHCWDLTEVSSLFMYRLNANSSNKQKKITKKKYLNHFHSSFLPIITYSYIHACHHFSFWILINVFY